MNFLKKRININVKIIAVALLCMFAFFYVIHHIGNAFKGKTELFMVTQATLPNTVELSGYIFRDEAVLTSTGMFCSYEFEDGKKVAKNATVANIFFSESAEIRQKYEDLRGRIEILEESSSLLHIDLAQVDAEINALRTDIAIKRTSGDFSFIDKAEKELLVLLHKRSLAEQNKKGYEAELAVLRAEFEALKIALAAAGAEVAAPEAGYFYSYTDGYESLCTEYAAKNISFSLFDEISSANPQKSGSIGKIAFVGKWYYVCKMSIEEAEAIVADEKYDGVFSDNACRQSLPLLTEQKLIDYVRGEALLVFSCSYVPDGFDFSRVQRAKLTLSGISGLRIPSSSVRVLEDGQTIVYIIKEGVCRPRNVNILFEKGGYCIVAEAETRSDLDLYDRIITGDSKLYDGKVIDY